LHHRKSMTTDLCRLVPRQLTANLELLMFFLTMLGFTRKPAINTSLWLWILNKASSNLMSHKEQAKVKPAYPLLRTGLVFWRCVTAC